MTFTMFPFIHITSLFFLVRSYLVILKGVFSVLLLLCYVKVVLSFRLIYMLYPEAIQATSPLSYLNLHFMSLLLLQIHSREQSMLCEAERTVCCKGAQHVRVGWCN